MIKPILTLDRYAEVEEATTVFHDRVVKILFKLHRRNPEHYCIRTYRIKFNQELVWLEGTPPKYKGMMMGGWFVATAIGNYLVRIGGKLWGDIPLWIVWSVFIGVCLIAAIFMFSIMKKLEEATK